MDLVGCFKAPGASPDSAETLYGFDRFYQSLKAAIKSSRETKACLVELADAYFMFSQRVQQISARLTRANQVNSLSGTVQSTWLRVAEAAHGDSQLHDAFANELTTNVVQPLTVLVQELVSSYKPLRNDVKRSNAVYKESLAVQVSEKKQAFALAKRFYEAAVTKQASPRDEAAMRKREARYVETCCETERARAAYYLSVQQAICRIDKLQERRGEVLLNAADKFDSALAARSDRLPPIRAQLRAAIDRVDIASDIERLRNAASATRRAPVDRSSLIARRTDEPNMPTDMEGSEAGASFERATSILVRSGDESERNADALDGILNECNTQWLVEFYAEEQNNVVYGNAQLRDAALSRKRDELRVEVERFRQNAANLRSQFIDCNNTAQAQSAGLQDTKVNDPSKSIGLIRRTPSGRFLADTDIDMNQQRDKSLGITPLQRDYARQQVTAVARRWFEVESVLLMLTASLWKLERGNEPNMDSNVLKHAEETEADALKRPIVSVTAFGESALPQFITKQSDSNGLWQTVLRIPMRVFVAHLPPEIGSIFRHDSLFATAAANEIHLQRQTSTRTNILRSAASFLSTARASMRLNTGRSMRSNQSRPSNTAGWVRPQAPSVSQTMPQALPTVAEPDSTEQVTDCYANVQFDASHKPNSNSNPYATQPATAALTMRTVAIAELDVEETHDSEDEEDEPYQNVVIHNRARAAAPASVQSTATEQEYMLPREAITVNKSEIVERRKIEQKHDEEAARQEAHDNAGGSPPLAARSGSMDSVERQIMDAAADGDERESIDAESFFTDEEIADDPTTDAILNSAHEDVQKDREEDNKRKSKQTANEYTPEPGALRALVITSTPKRVEATQQPSAANESMQASVSVSVAGSSASASVSRQRSQHEASPSQPQQNDTTRSNASAASASRPAAPPRPKEIPAHLRAQMQRKNAAAEKQHEVSPSARS